MKNSIHIVVLLLVALGLSSCVENSKKYQELLAERDSLQVEASNVTTDFESSLQTINEIEMALQTIREAENIIMIENQEGNTNYAVSQIEAIDRTIQQNKAKIEDLEKQLAQAGSKSKQLNATISRLKSELDEKDTYINTLRVELNESKAQVAELAGQVEDLNRNVEDLNENINDLNAQSAEQQATIRLQDAAINTVYYIVASMEDLKEAGLVTKAGLFAKETVSNNIDKGLMMPIDKREVAYITLHSKKAIIMTNHPESSYQLVKGDDDLLSLNIIDKEAFWNTSNYLIISIK